MKNQRVILSRVCLLAAALSLAACNILPESKKIEYKSAGKKLPSLEVPPDLTAPGRDDRYVVPDVGARGTTTYSAYADKKASSSGNNTNVLPEVGNLRIERSGTQRWLVVPGYTPEQLWPIVKEFWQETGLLVNVEQPEAGVMETDWAENRAKLPQDAIRNLLGKVLDSLYSTAERDKFRTRLEKGPDGSTEVYISHRGMYEIYVTEGKSETRWQPREPDPELEAEMLRRLMVRLGTDNEKAKSMLAAAAPKEERAKLTLPRAGGGTLEVAESFDRAWRRVGLALDRVGFTVEDRDRSQGMYYVRYVDPEADVKTKQDTGLLSKLAFWKSNSKDITKDAQYRIHVKPSGNGSSVQVLTREGGVDTSDTSRKILSLLHEQLK